MVTLYDKEFKSLLGRGAYFFTPHYSWLSTLLTISEQVSYFEKAQLHLDLAERTTGKSLCSCWFS